LFPKGSGYQTARVSSPAMVARPVAVIDVLTTGSVVARVTFPY
jgi:hypothetical protein